MCNRENDSCCFNEILCGIVKLQRQSECPSACASTCDRPYLGLGTTSCLYNTRPINLYSCCNSTLWSMPYTLNGETGTSTVFRVEAVEDCCATFRILAPNPDETSDVPYVATDNFFTMNLNCTGAISCLPDTYISCI